jgi:hypothetical protein
MRRRKPDLSATSNTLLPIQESRCRPLRHQAGVISGRHSSLRSTAFEGRSVSAASNLDVYAAVLRKLLTTRRLFGLVALASFEVGVVHDVLKETAWLRES